MRDPVLGSTEYKGNRFTIFGGLHHIRGNGSPYFSITYEETTKRGRDIAYGSDGRLIARLFSHFADLVAMHLSDIDGKPMHGDANGWYWYCGALGGNGERYHGGSDHTAEKCADILSKHLRISKDDTANLIARNVSRAQFNEFVEQQTVRWKDEALACIAKHKLVVYGDPWPGAAA